MDKYTGDSPHPLQASKAELTDFVEKQANIKNWQHWQPTL
jgi:hypothetical protein